jgi:hypothetical protein
VGVRTQHTFAGLACSALLALTLPHAAIAAEPPLAAPPAIGDVALTTNAMLQSGEVPPVLGGGDGSNVGYIIPPGGQDPFPLCAIPGGNSVLPSLTSAVGFSSTSGLVTQNLYVYPSAEQAQANWQTLRTQIDRRCSRVDTFDNFQWRSTRGTLDNGAQEGRWIRVDSTQTENPAYFSVVGPSDNAIVITRFRGKDGLRTTTPAQRLAVHAIFDTLEQRYANRDQIPMAQPALINQGATGLLRPDDLPTALPIQAAAQGGWSDWSAQVPAQDPFNRCNPRKKLLPVDTGSFSASFGGADVFVQTGSVYQQVFTYNSAQAAQASWDRLTTTIKDCNESSGTLYAEGGNRRAVTSSLTLEDMPGLRIRSIDSENYGPGSRFVTNTYGVYLLTDDAIVFVQYARSERGMKPFTLDEAAINSLAVFATQKWKQAE